MFNVWCFTEHRHFHTMTVTDLHKARISQRVDTVESVGPGQYSWSLAPFSIR